MNTCTPTNETPVMPVFFFPYCTFDIPSNILLKRLRPSVSRSPLPVFHAARTGLTGLLDLVAFHHRGLGHLYHLHGLCPHLCRVDCLSVSRVPGSRSITSLLPLTHVTRFFMGAFEAGLLPGVVYYLTMWYCPEDLGLVCRPATSQRRLCRTRR